jgi:bacterioferritin-associated ferredoxin
MIKECSAKGKSGLEMLKSLGLGSDCGICVLDQIQNHHSAEKLDLKNSLKKSDR